MSSFSAFAAECDRNLVGRPPRPNLELNIWRYNGQADFNSAHHLHLAFDLDRQSYRTEYVGLARGKHDYYPLGSDSVRQYSESYRMVINPLQDEFSANGSGETIYERLQNFSLGLMKNIEYVNSEEAKMHVKSSFQLSPDQVTIFEATEEKKESELIAEFGKIPEAARRSSVKNAWGDYQSHFALELLEDNPDEYVPPKRDPYYELKTALSWLVSGQNGEKKFILPIESGLLQPVDRKKYKYAWEVGRAGQTKFASFQETLRASAYFALHELIVLNGDIIDAYVFAHSLDPVHTRLYKSKFGMTEHSGYKNSPDEKCLVAPLSQFLKLFPIEEFSQVVSDIVKSSRGKIKPIKALELLIRYRQSLDMFGESPFGKLAIRNFSVLPKNMLRIEIEKFRLSNKSRIEVEQIFEHEAPAFMSDDSIGDYAGAQTEGHIFDVRGIYERENYASSKNGLLRLRTFLYRQNAIEVSPVKEYEHAPGIALAETYLAIKLNLSVMGIQDPKQYLQTLGVHFCFTDETRKLGTLVSQAPNAKWFIQRGKYVTYMKLGGGRRIPRTIADAIDISSLCFSAEQIEEWMKHPDRPKELLKFTKENEARFLKNPQLYEP